MKGYHFFSYSCNNSAREGGREGEKLADVAIDQCHSPVVFDNGPGAAAAQPTASSVVLTQKFFLLFVIKGADMQIGATRRKHIKVETESNLIYYYLLTQLGVGLSEFIFHFFFSFFFCYSFVDGIANFFLRRRRRRKENLIWTLEMC